MCNRIYATKRRCICESNSHTYAKLNGSKWSVLLVSVFVYSRLTFLAKTGYSCTIFSQNWTINALTARYIRNDGQLLKRQLQQNSKAERASPNKNVDAISF